MTGPGLYKLVRLHNLNTIKFLGLIIGPNGGVSKNPKKVNGIMNWPTPIKVKKVQETIGLADFFHQFIKNFSKIATPLDMGHSRIEGFTMHFFITF